MASYLHSLHLSRLSRSIKIYYIELIYDSSLPSIGLRNILSTLTVLSILTVLCILSIFCILTILCTCPKNMTIIAGTKERNLVENEKQFIKQ